MQTMSKSPFASVIGLGAFKAEYASTGRGKWVGLVVSLGLVAAGPVLILYAAYRAFDAYNNYGSTRVDNAIIPPLCIAAGALVIGMLALTNLWRNWSVAAALYENGVAYRNRSAVVQTRWDEIDTVHQAVTRHYTNGVYTGTTHVYTIRTKTGQKISLTDRLGKNVETLGNEVQRGAAAMLFPRYWQSLQSGQRVTFGPLAMDREKLYAGKKELRWDEITAIKVEKGVIAIKKDKGWFNWGSAMVPQIPNFYIFYDLVSRFAKVE